MTWRLLSLSRWMAFFVAFGPGAGCQGKPDGPPPPRPGYSDCDGNAANGAETNVKSSVEHCGYCSHACQAVHGTAACVDGQCQPKCDDGYAPCEHLSDKGCTTNLASSRNHCGACRHRCPETYCRAGTCEPSVHVAADIEDAYRLEYVVDGSAYLLPSYTLPAASISLFVVPTDGVEAAQKPSKRLVPRGFVPSVRHGDHFFGCRTPALPMGSDCRLARAGLDGTELEQLALVHQAFAFHMAADDRYLYIPTGSDLRHYTVNRVPVDGGEPEALFEVADLYSMAADAGDLFWSRTGPLGVWVLRKGTSDAVQLWDQSCGAIAVDAKYVYCVDLSEIYRLPRSATKLVGKEAEGVELLATVPEGWTSSIDGLVVTDDSVYYGISKAVGFLDVRRIRKPDRP